MKTIQELKAKAELLELEKGSLKERRELKKKIFELEHQELVNGGRMFAKAFKGFAYGLRNWVDGMAYYIIDQSKGGVNHGTNHAGRNIP